MNSNTIKITLSMLGSILTLTLGVSLIVQIIREWKYTNTRGLSFLLSVIPTLIIAWISLVCCFFLLKYLFKKLKNIH